jgi:methylsterol monooxygenase
VVFWPAYKALAKRFRNKGWSDKKFFTVLFCTMISATWTGFNGFYALIEHKRWLEQYKIDRGHHQLGSWKLALATIKESVLGKLFVAPIGIYLVFTEILQKRGILQRVCDFKRPSAARLYLNFLIATVFNEVAFYCAHRSFHHPALYAKFHKQHHEWKGTVSFAAENAHPVEQIFANYIPTFGGCLLLGVHPWTLCVWVCERLRTTYEGHSGYAFDVHPVLTALNITNYKAAAEHDFHHTANTGNFGPQWRDWLCGTMDSWAVAGCEKEYLKSKMAEKLSYMHPSKVHGDARTNVDAQKDADIKMSVVSEERK